MDLVDWWTLEWWTLDWWTLGFVDSRPGGLKTGGLDVDDCPNCLLHFYIPVTCHSSWPPHPWATYPNLHQTHYPLQLDPLISINLPLSRFPLFPPAHSLSRSPHVFPTYLTFVVAWFLNRPASNQISRAIVHDNDHPWQAQRW